MSDLIYKKEKSRRIDVKIHHSSELCDLLNIILMTLVPDSTPFTSESI